MGEARCLICLGDLTAGEMSYHPACCRELFDAPQPPLLPYSQEEMDELATKVIRQHVTVPGVQPKLSLHLEREAKSGTGRFTIVGLEGGYILKPPVSRYPDRSRQARSSPRRKSPNPPTGKLRTAGHRPAK